MGDVRFKAEVEITCKKCYTSIFCPGIVHIYGQVDVDSVPDRLDIAHEDVDLPDGWGIFKYTHLYCPTCLEKAEAEQKKREDKNKKQKERKTSYGFGRSKPCFRGRNPK